MRTEGVATTGNKNSVFEKQLADGALKLGGGLLADVRVVHGGDGLLEGLFVGSHHGQRTVGETHDALHVLEILVLAALDLLQERSRDAESPLHLRHVVSWIAVRGAVLDEMSRLTASIAHVPWWRYSLLLRWSASAHAAATTDSASSSHPSRGRRYIAPRASDDGVDLVLLGFGDEAAGRSSRLLILWSSGDDLGRSGLDGGLLIEGGRDPLGDDVRVLRNQVIILVVCC